MVLTLLVMLPEILTRPLFGDDAINLWDARQIANGAAPVRDFFCIDPAGDLAYFSLFRTAFGESSVAYWAMITVNVLTTASLLGWLSRRLGGTRTMAIWAGFLFCVFQFRCVPAYGLVGKDMLGLPFVLGGLLLCKSGRWRLLGQLVMGVGIAIKPTLGAIWLVWVIAQFIAERPAWYKWVAATAVGGAAIGTPFLLATWWAEQNGWGWAAIRTTLGLSGHYGSYWSGAAIYKLCHVALSQLWLFPLAVSGWRAARRIPLARSAEFWALLGGGFINWAIQPMFNGWYFTAFTGAIVVLAAFGLTSIIGPLRAQVPLMALAAFYVLFIPATNLRWLKLVTDIKGKEPYTLADHQTRIMEEYSIGKTTPIDQAWIRAQVSKFVQPGAKVGVLVNDGNLLWALRDYRPGFWAVWSPDWNPSELTKGVASGSAELIVGVEQPVAGQSSYANRMSQLWWPMPDEARLALERGYEDVQKGRGFVIYLRRSPAISAQVH